MVVEFCFVVSVDVWEYGEDNGLWNIEDVVIVFVDKGDDFECILREDGDY